MRHTVRHTLILGAAGQMTQVAARHIHEALPELRLTLADRDLAAVQRVAASCGGEAVTAVQLDLFDDAALRKALIGVDFVVLGAGPFFETAERVMRACIAAGASYMDIDDDVESTLQALALDAEARAAGVTLYVGHGASPGMSNVLGLDLMQRMDETHDLEVAWCVGEDRNARIGRAVADHTLHIGAGTFTGFRDGRQQTRESFTESTCFPLAPPLGPYRLYECAHPEPVMFGHTHPTLRNAICWGGLHPQPLNGALRGLALAVRDGRLDRAAARALLLSAAQGNAGEGGTAVRTRDKWRAARHAVAGMLSQFTAGESSLREFATIGAAGGKDRAAIVAVGARARGVRGGKTCELVAKVEVRVPRIPGGAMAAATGACEAQFFEFAIRGDGAAPGIAFPQAWVQPQAFYTGLSERMARAGGAFHVQIETL